MNTNRLIFMATRASIASMACIFLLTACSPTEKLADSVQELTNALVPDQQREFVRQYSDHLLAGNIEAADAMIETREYCMTDRRRETDARPDHSSESGSCSGSADTLRAAQYLIDGREPDKVNISNYHWHMDADGKIRLNMTLEYRYGEDVIRTGIRYRREDDKRWIERTSITLDTRTFQERTWQILDEKMLLPLWILLGAQLLAFLIVPVVVLHILKRQRERRAVMLGSESSSREGKFKA